MISPKKTEYSKILFNRNESYSSSFGTGIKFYIETKLILKNLLSALIDCEIAINIKKKKLISIPGFSNYESYEIIKGKFKSFILKEDVYKKKFYIFLYFYVYFYVYFIYYIVIWFYAKKWLFDN